MRRALLLSLAPLAPLVLVAPVDAAATDDVSLGFSTIAGTRSSSVSLVNDGTSATSQRVVTSGGGQAVPAATAAATSGAVQLPAYTNGSASSPRAVVAVSNSGSTDALSPGSRSFAFGADIRLDAVNRGGSGDNGNNVIQRGLYGTGAQFKLQVDGSTADCRVEGGQGSVLVSAPVAAGAWYRLTCSVTAQTTSAVVTVTAAPISSSGSLGTARSSSASARIGTLSYAVRTPLSVGGKLTEAGTLVSSADQFNGRIDNAWLSIS